MYKLWAKHKRDAWEEIDETDNFEDALNLQKEYSMAYGAGWTIKIVRYRE